MKAVVMETRKNEAAVLLKDGTFRIVKGKYTVGETIEYREKPRFIGTKWMAAAAALVLAAGTGGGFWYDANYVAYAEISVDVNPSIIYTINRRNRVLSVRAVNDESGAVVSTLKDAGIRFLPVSEAIEKTMTIFEDEGYLDSENEDYVLMNVSADSSELQDKLTSEIDIGMEHALERDPSMEFRVDRSDRATARRASEQHISTGRYAVWEQEGGEREITEYADMPIREMMGGAAPEGTGGPGAEMDTPSIPLNENQGGVAPDTEPSARSEQEDDTVQAGAPANRPNAEKQQEPSGPSDQPARQSGPPMETPENHPAEDPDGSQPDGMSDLLKGAPAEIPAETPNDSQQPPAGEPAGAAGEQPPDAKVQPVEENRPEAGAPSAPAGGPEGNGTAPQPPGGPGGQPR